MKFKITDESLKFSIEKSNSWREVCLNLSIKDRGGNQSNLKHRAIKAGLEFKHFPGRSYRKGRCFLKKDLQLYLSGQLFIKSHALRIRLIQEGIKSNCCEKCGVKEWQGEPVILELDHINSDHKDNRLENLQILCPNCHALLTRQRQRKPKEKKKRKNRDCTHLRKVKNRPDIQILRGEVDQFGYCAVGRKYGVSDNAIRKWIKAGMG